MNSAGASWHFISSRRTFAMFLMTSFGTSELRPPSNIPNNESLSELNFNILSVAMHSLHIQYTVDNTLLQAAFHWIFTRPTIIRTERRILISLLTLYSRLWPVRTDTVRLTCCDCQKSPRSRLSTEWQHPVPDVHRCSQGFSFERVQAVVDFGQSYQRGKRVFYSCTASKPYINALHFTPVALVLRSLCAGIAKCSLLMNHNRIWSLLKLVFALHWTSFNVHRFLLIICYRYRVELFYHLRR